MVHAPAAVTLSPLDRADGSASYSSHGYTAIGGVNGPVEVQRRDELPEEAAIDVVVRPAAGIGGVRERHIESIIQNTLRQVILVSAHPRTLIQVTLQIVAAQEDECFSVNGVPQAASNIDILPTLFQTAMLALLSASIPLVTTMTATLIAINARGDLSPNPSAKDLTTASSLHVLAFSSFGELLVVESEGQFSLDVWEGVVTQARGICLGFEKEGDGGEDVCMDVEEEQERPSLQAALRTTIEKRFKDELKWKESLGCR
ncbi:MAG: hypothetical protein Q9163_005352 [Psora crenata]